MDKDKSGKLKNGFVFITTFLVLINIQQNNINSPVKLTVLIPVFIRQNRLDPGGDSFEFRLISKLASTAIG